MKKLSWLGKSEHGWAHIKGVAKANSLNNRYA